MSFQTQLETVKNDLGFLAALDQSGGSTPKALKLYGVDESAYQNDEEMFDQVHAMRTRIMTCESFRAGSILGAILFEMTMDRTVEGQSTSEYLWNEKQIVPFLKVDKGLADEQSGVQLMKPISDLQDLLPRAKAQSVFGTKMRSVIKSADNSGIQAVVEQQFRIADEIRALGLVPIIEPEVDINAADKAECEVLLRAAIQDQLMTMDGELPVMLKLTLPSEANFYSQLCEHPKVLKVVALSGGYSRAEANRLLTANHSMIASFSRALSEGLSHQMSDAEFNEVMTASIAQINAASAT